MHHRATSRRTVLAATATAAATAATGAAAPRAAAVPVPAPVPVSAAGHDAGGARERGLLRLLSRMSLEEKVGQLFVMRVYGHSATHPDQADVDANLREIGVRTAAELVARYRVGGIIYFAWAHNTRDPHQIADLSNGIQRAALAGRTPCRCSSPPTRSTAPWRGWASPRRCCPARWRSARPVRGTRPGAPRTSPAPNWPRWASARTTRPSRT